MPKLKYFRKGEFACKQTGENNMDTRFVKRLDRLRGRCGFPFVITSGYRSVEHSAEIDKPIPGTHTRGIAVDIAVEHGHQRYLIVSEAIAMGFCGIGVAKNFIHIDDRDDTPVIWTY